MWLNPSMPHRTEPNDKASSLIQNPLVASVLRENVRVADGRAMIGLWEGGLFSFRSCRPSVRSLRLLGMATQCSAPLPNTQVVSVPCGHRGRAVDGSLEFDFTSWARGTAVVESRREGWLYAVEFSDHSGEVIHKICLTEQSDFEAFRAWVELNQSSSASRGFDGARGVVAREFISAVRLGRRDVGRSTRHSSRWPLPNERRFQVIVGNEGAAGRRHDPTMFRRDREWIFVGDQGGWSSPSCRETCGSIP